MPLQVLPAQVHHPQLQVPVVKVNESSGCLDALISKIWSCVQAVLNFLTCGCFSSSSKQESEFHKFYQPENDSPRTSQYRTVDSSYRRFTPSSIPFPEPPQTHFHHRESESNTRQTPSRFSESDLDKELKKISDLCDRNKKEKLYAQLAEKYLIIGCWKKALETIKKIYIDTKTQEAFIVKVANADLQRGDRDKALKTIKKIYSTKTQEAFLAQVAESYFSEGNLEKALETIKKIYSDTKTQEAFIVKVANAYLQRGDRNKALKTIKEIYIDTKTQEAFIVKVANADLQRGDRDKALKTIKKMYTNTKTQDAFIVKVANADLQRGDRDKALETSIKIYSNKTQEAFLAQVAESYFSEGNLEKALQTINKLYDDTKTQEAFIVKVVNAYIQRGERDKAIGAINNLYSNTQGKFALLIQIAQSYFSENDEAGVLKAIKEIVHDSLRSKLVKSGQHSIYFEIMMENIGNDLTNNFFSGLAKDCFVQAKVHFTQNNAQAILQEIIRKSTDSLTIQSFLNLKTGQSHARSESSRKRTSSNQGYSRSQNEARNQSSNPTAPCYSILELQPTASKEDIRNAYKKLALKYHPDKVKRNQNENEIEFERRRQACEERFKLISEAYRILDECYID